MGNNTPKHLIFEFAGTAAILLSVSGCAPIFKMMGVPLRAHCIGAGVTSVSASAHSDTFVISYCDDKKSLIAVGEYDYGDSKVVLTSPNSLLLRPVFLNKSGDIAFIERPTVDKSSINALFGNGSTTHLTDEGSNSDNITDMVMSGDEQTIYYVNSHSYGHSSPVGSYMPHNNDFYSLSMPDKTAKRLSFSNEYHLPGISISRDEKTIFSRSNVLDSGETKIKKLLYQVKAGLPFTDGHLTYTSKFPLSQVSTENQMILSCGKVTKFRKYRLGDTQEINGYGLFLIQLPDRKVIKEILYLPAHLDSPTILEKHGVVLFIREPFEKPLFGKSKRELWSVKMDGSDLKRIHLKGIE